MFYLGKFLFSNYEYLYILKLVIVIYHTILLGCIPISAGLYVTFLGIILFKEQYYITDPMHQILKIEAVMQFGNFDKSYL